MKSEQRAQVAWIRVVKGSPHARAKISLALSVNIQGSSQPGPPPAECHKYKYQAPVASHGLLLDRQRTGKPRVGARLRTWGRWLQVNEPASRVPNRRQETGAKVMIH